MPENDSPQLGRLAVERGLLTAEEMAEAVREQERRRAAGSEVRALVRNFRVTALK